MTSAGAGPGRVAWGAARGATVVKRDKVVDERGRGWVSGLIRPDEYFAEAARTAREQARRTVQARLRRSERRPAA